MRSETAAAPGPDRAAFHGPLIAWYAANGRHDLPWRLTRDPYAVLISEVMLQQTQVERVTPYYAAWMARWPDAHALARAPLAEVIRAWSGLGYNRRAVNLHRAAVAVAASGGGFPIEVAALRGLPGVGPYTAAAVASFAGETAVPVIETNVGRVLARAVHGVAAVRDLRPAELAVTALALLPADGAAARHHNLALMDLGALICGSRSPQCERCPLVQACAWRAAGSPAPVTRPAAVPRFETTARFARGRVVEALRELGSASEATLAEHVGSAHAGRLPGYLAALERDGLIARDAADGWRLAG